MKTAKIAGYRISENGEMAAMAAEKLAVIESMEIIEENGGEMKCENENGNINEKRNQ
jgi:hypothetical protein